MAHRGRARRGASIRRRTALGLVALLSLAVGCSDSTGPGDPALTIRFQAPPTDALQLRVFVGEVSVLLSQPGERRIELAEGTHPVVTVLRELDRSLRFEAGYAVWFARGTDYWIDVIVGGSRPEGMCVGEVSVLGVIQSDSVFVVRNSLRRGALC